MRHTSIPEQLAHSDGSSYSQTLCLTGVLLTCMPEAMSACGLISVWSSEGRSALAVFSVAVAVLAAAVAVSAACAAARWRVRGEGRLSPLRRACEAVTSMSG